MIGMSSATRLRRHRDTRSTKFLEGEWWGEWRALLSSGRSWSTPEHPWTPEKKTMKYMHKTNVSSVLIQWAFEYKHDTHPHIYHYHNHGKVVPIYTRLQNMLVSFFLQKMHFFWFLVAKCSKSKKWKILCVRGRDDIFVQIYTPEKGYQANLGLDDVVENWGTRLNVDLVCTINRLLLVQIEMINYEVFIIFYWNNFYLQF